MIINYKYGFRYFNKVYCWKDKKLYRMPFNNKLRWHEKKELKQVKNGITLGYYIDRAFKSMKNLKELTEIINQEETTKPISECPF